MKCTVGVGESKDLQSLRLKVEEGEAVIAAQRDELDKLKGAVADKVEQVKSEVRQLENVISKEVEKWKREVEISREEGKNLKRKVGELTEEVDRWKVEVQKSRQEEAKLSGEVEDLKMEGSQMTK